MPEDKVVYITPEAAMKYAYRQARQARQAERERDYQSALEFYKDVERFHDEVYHTNPKHNRCHVDRDWHNFIGEKIKSLRQRNATRF